MFAPFVIKQHRNEIKRYETMFTCMTSRAVHIEIIHSLDSDSFIQALRQVIACRENIKVSYSDICWACKRTEESIQRNGQ